jgi:RNA polymerase sigma factor (sigma-70 family)
LASDDEPPTLAALYLRNREVMLRAARAILRNQHDAEDAVSAAVVRFAVRLADGYLPDDPDAYLIQSARNAALDQRRASARRLRHEMDDLMASGVRSSVGNPQPATDVMEAVPDIVDQVIERQRNAEVRAAVQRTIDGLPKREAIMLSLLLTGHSRVEIGARYNRTGQRVGQLLKRPIANLLGELGVQQSATRHRARKLSSMATDEAVPGEKEPGHV